MRSLLQGDKILSYRKKERGIRSGGIRFDEGGYVAMRAGRSRKRVGKRFVRNLIWVLVAYAPFAAILTLGSDTTLLGALVFGGIVVPVVATFVTVVMFKADASDEASEVPPAVYNPGANHGAIGSGHHGGGSWDSGGFDSGGFGGGGDGSGGSG